MIRLGLFLYLILAMAAGPGLCCCFAEGFGSLLTKEKSTKSCCPNHPNNKKEVPAKHLPGPCPCQEDRVSPNPAWAVERGDFFGATSFQFICVPGLHPPQLLLVAKLVTRRSCDGLVKLQRNDGHE